MNQTPPTKAPEAPIQAKEIKSNDALEQKPVDPGEKQAFDELLKKTRQKKQKEGDQQDPMGLMGLIRKKTEDLKGVSKESKVELETPAINIGHQQGLADLLQPESIKTSAAGSTIGQSATKIEALSNQVVDSFHSMRTANSSEVRITVKPEVLEATQIQIKKTGSDVTVNFLTANYSSQAIIQQHKSELEKALKKRTTTSNVSISVNGPKEASRALLGNQKKEELLV